MIDSESLGFVTLVCKLRLVPGSLSGLHGFRVRSRTISRRRMPRRRRRWSTRPVLITPITPMAPPTASSLWSPWSRIRTVIPLCLMSPAIRQLLGVEHGETKWEQIVCVPKFQDVPSQWLETWGSMAQMGWNGWEPDLVQECLQDKWIHKRYGT